MELGSETFCPCCNSSVEGKSFSVLSWRAEYQKSFRYQECVSCGSLYLVDVPGDISGYYQNYELHRGDAVAAPSSARVVAARMAAVTLFSSNLSGLWEWLVPTRPDWIFWFAGSGIDLKSPILDVGAGDGRLVRYMRDLGFSAVEGVDPYLPESVGNGFVRKLTLSEVEGQYDVILYIHSLEHIASPIDALLEAKQHLYSTHSRVVVALPLVEGPIWERYRDNWVGLDAPLHLFVPSMKGLMDLVGRAGLRVVRSRREMNDYHLLGSERIARRIPKDVPNDEVFSQDQWGFFKREVKRIRRQSLGPQVTVVLEPVK